MLGPNAITVSKVGNGPGDPQNAIVPTSGQAETIDRSRQEHRGRLIGVGARPHGRRAQSRVRHLLATRSPKLLRGNHPPANLRA
jgi:hypothetical protein